MRRGCRSSGLVMSWIHTIGIVFIYVDNFHNNTGGVESILTLCCKILTCGVGELAQLIECWLCEHWDLSLEPQHSLQKLNMVTCWRE